MGMPAKLLLIGVLILGVGYTSVLSVEKTPKTKFGAVFLQKPLTKIRQIESAKGVINRLIPGIINHFTFEIINRENDLDVFELEQAGDKLVLRGNNGVSLCSAFNYYLEEYCHCDISWCGDQLNIPKPFPVVRQKVRIVSPSKYRVYFNYCTLSYTASWWDWDRWQREIDFMALKGVNMPLSPIGVEGVWYNVLQDFEMTESEARTFLCGPPYLAWQWMTNIQSLGGPMPKSWIDSHIKLGQKIIERERSLGMTPIQQGFSGFVPVKFKEKFPDAKIYDKREWAGRTIPAVQLDPLDSLFSEFGAAFMAEQKRLFGENHFYAADPFHEGTPPVDTPEYLHAVGKTTYELMQKSDPEAIWVMQSWSIRKDIACAVPKDRLLILNLSGKKYEKTDNFWGYPFVNGVLHNFGGRTMLHGILEPLAKNLFLSVKPAAENLVGIGLFMEGTVQNPVYYNMMFNSIWRNEPVKATEWLHNYAHRRYGAASDGANKAWNILLKSAYSNTTGGIEQGSIVATRPTLKITKTAPQRKLKIPYDPYLLVQAWGSLLQDRDILKDSDGYRFDVVDTGRQALTNLGLELHNDVCLAYYAKDKIAFKKAADKFLGLLKDIDDLVGTRSEYRLYNWINEAREWGETAEEKDKHEMNARMLLTRWGPLTMQRAWDYSWREWQGLIKSYYLPRWSMFFQHLAKTIDEGVVYDDQKVKLSQGRPALRATPFLDKLTNWEITWIESHDENDYALPKKQFSEVELSLSLLEKYSSDIKRVYLNKIRK